MKIGKTERVAMAVAMALMLSTPALMNASRQYIGKGGNYIGPGKRSLHFYWNRALSSKYRAAHQGKRELERARRRYGVARAVAA